MAREVSRTEQLTPPLVAGHHVPSGNHYWGPGHTAGLGLPPARTLWREKPDVSTRLGFRCHQSPVGRRAVLKASIFKPWQQDARVSTFTLPPAIATWSFRSWQDIDAPLMAGTRSHECSREASAAQNRSPFVRNSLA